MSLLDRRYILVSVPTANDALIELQNSEVDLLVTAYHLPDATGIELADRAIRESAGTSLIILADPQDPEQDPAMLANASYAYFIRPVGEQFMRAFRAGLGEAVAAEQSSSASSSSLDLGPLAPLDIKSLQGPLFNISREIRPSGFFVADRLGKVVHSEGATGYFDIHACAIHLAPQFAGTVNVRDWIGGNSWSLQYFDGDDYDLVAMSLGLHYFLVLIFEKGMKIGWAAVFRDGRENTDKVAETIGPDAWTFRRQIVTRMTQSIPLPTINYEEALTDEGAPVSGKRATGPHEAAIGAVVIEEVAPLPELHLEALEEFDVNRVFNQQVDESAFDDFFSDEDFNDDSLLTGAGSLSFDEASTMGIILDE